MGSPLPGWAGPLSPLIELGQLQLEGGEAVEAGARTSLWESQEGRHGKQARTSVGPPRAPDACMRPVGGAEISMGRALGYC